MPYPKPDAEDALERAAVDLFADLGWRTVFAYDETYGSQGTLGRTHRGQVVLVRELRPAVQRLNPNLPAAALDAAVEELARDRSALGFVQADHAIYDLLKNGVKVVYTNDDGDQADATVQVIDWRTPANNDFLLVSQLWVTGDMYTRRADLVGFVNELPLLFIQLKAHTRSLKLAYDGNLHDYKERSRTCSGTTHPLC